MQPTSPTLGSWLEEWLSTYVPIRCQPKTAERYRQLAGYTSRGLGLLTLDQLSHRAIETWLFSLLSAKATRRKHLSARTVRHIGALLNAALDKACRLDLIAANPMLKVELPRAHRKRARSLTGDEVNALREACRGDWSFLLVEVALATGCRRGELLALEWTDIDWQSSALHIDKSLEQTRAGLRIKNTKSERSRRCTLPAIAMGALKQARSEQRLIFPDLAGGHRLPDLVSQMVVRRMRKAGIRQASLHTLRHTHASSLISRGVPLTAISARLGHADASITAQIYCHALPLDDQRAAEEWDKFLRI